MAYIQFYYPKRMCFSPLDYENGLGGTESSLVLLAEGLAKKGHFVEVFCACWNPGYYNGVSWRGAWEINNSPAPDVLVHVRTASSVIEKQACTHLFWMLDDRSDGANTFHHLYPQSIVIIESDAMKQRLSCDIPQAFINLPVEYDRLDGACTPSQSKVCIHTSMPNRGLIELLHLWPMVRRKIPDALLEVTSGWELWGYTKEEAKDRFAQLFGGEIPELHGIKLNGVLSKECLFSKIKQSRMCIIPSYFPEMFCISAAEASSAGRPLIVSNYEALKERVTESTGFGIDGDIRQESVRDEFVDKIVYLYEHDDVLDAMGEKARAISIKYSVDMVVRSWEALF